MATHELVRATVAEDLAVIRADFVARNLVTPDPALFPIGEVRARNEAYFAAIAEPRVDVRAIHLAQVTAEDGHVVDLKIAVPHGATPGGPSILYCHGGGYTFGDLATHDPVIRAFAAATGMVVVGVHYRRTPEHRFPAPLLDALAAYQAMGEATFAAAYGFDPARRLVLGDSAGAHLCLSLMLALRQRGLPQPLAAALIYGMYDDRTDSPSHRLYGDGAEGLSTARMQWFWQQLLPEGHADRPVYANLLQQNLDGLPPLALSAAECDCLLSDTLDLVAGCKAAGHPHRFTLFGRMPHGFMNMPSVYAGTREAMGLVARDLRELIA